MLKLFQGPKCFLIDFDGNRQNNFTIIRILLAWLVLYGHSYAVQNKTGIHDPLNQIFQGSIWIGALAVNGFFAISGFLVTASIIKRGFWDYSISRILRIYPALIVCIIFTVFVIGPIFSNVSVSEYLASTKTYDYLKNATLYFPIKWTIPSVFENNSKASMNGSLWTLPLEVRCYLFLALISLFKIFKIRVIANIVLISILVIGIYNFKALPLVSVSVSWSRPALYFLMGSFVFVNRDKIPLNGLLAIIAIGLMGFSFGENWFLYVFPITLIYLIFYLVYKTKYLNIDNKFGDISYGIYIYAWPIQQVVASVFPQFEPFENTLLSSFLVFILAFTSWHYLEKPFLSLKKIFLR